MVRSSMHMHKLWEVRPVRGGWLGFIGARGEGCLEQRQTHAQKAT